MTLVYWYWLTLGLLLILAETLGVAGFLLTLGMAALCNGLLVWLMPMSWQWQLTLYSVCSIVFVLIWWSIWKKQKESPPSLMNQPALSLVGRTTVLSAAIVHGRGKVQLNDAYWFVTGPELPVGTSVKIIAVEDSALLRVAPCNLQDG